MKGKGFRMIVEIELNGIVTAKRVPPDIAEAYRNGGADLAPVRRYFESIGYTVGYIKVC